MRKFAAFLLILCLLFGTAACAKRPTHEKEPVDLQEKAVPEPIDTHRLEGEWRGSGGDVVDGVIYAELELDDDGEFFYQYGWMYSEYIAYFEGTYSVLGVNDDGSFRTQLDLTGGDYENDEIIALAPTEQGVHDYAPVVDIDVSYREETDCNWLTFRHVSGEELSFEKFEYVPEERFVDPYQAAYEATDDYDDYDDYDDFDDYDGFDFDSLDEDGGFLSKPRLSASERDGYLGTYYFGENQTRYVTVYEQNGNRISLEICCYSRSHIGTIVAEDVELVAGHGTFSYMDSWANTGICEIDFYDQNLDLQFHDQQIGDGALYGADICPGTYTWAEPVPEQFKPDKR